MAFLKGILPLRCFVRAKPSRNEEKELCDVLDHTNHRTATEPPSPKRSLPLTPLIRIRPSRNDEEELRDGPDCTNHSAITEPPKRRMPSPIGNLPHDLVYELGKYLSAVDLLCLSYTCRGLSNALGLDFTNTLGGPRHQFMYSQHGDKECKENELMVELLNRLRGDSKSSLHAKLFPPNHMICNKCVTVHDETAFAHFEQGKYYRKCRGASRSFWLCPHKEFNYYRLRFDQHLGTDFPCARCNIYVDLRENATHIRIPLLDVPNAGPPPANEELRTLLRDINAPLCPHLSLNSSFVLNLYEKDCGDTWSEWNEGSQACKCRVCQIPPQDRCCQECKAKIKFNRCPEGSECLRLDITRDLTQFKSINDPAWLSQLDSPYTDDGYGSGWQALTALSDPLIRTKGTCRWWG